MKQSLLSRNVFPVRRDFPIIGKIAGRFSNHWKLFSAALILCTGVAQGASEFSLLGTNGVEIANGGAPSNGNGTDFGVVAYNTAVTNVFSITNGGPDALIISEVTVSGYNTESFEVAGMPAAVEAGTASNFSVVFAPGGWRPFDLAIRIENDSTNTPFVLNVTGDVPDDPFFTSASSGTAVYGGAFSYWMQGFDPLDESLTFSWTNLPPWMTYYSTGGGWTVYYHAGRNTRGFSGDGGPATSAEMAWPNGVVVDDKGRSFIADQFNNRVRMVDTNGIIWTYAGGGTNTAFGIPATNAAIGATDVALDRKGNLYVCDGARVRMVDTNGILTSHMAVATSSGQTSFVFLFLEVNWKRIDRTRRVRGAFRVSGLPASRVCSYSWTRPGPAF